jgi:integrase
MRAKLTKTTVRKLEPKPARYEVADADMPALRVRVTPQGIKTFALLYRNASGKQARYTIGKFGDLTPEQARDIASRKLAEISLGTDPAAEKQEQRREAKRAQHATLGGFMDHKYGPWVEANRKAGAATLARLRACFSPFMDRELAALNPWLLESWRKARLSEGRAVSTINRDLSALRAALNRAVEWELIAHNPMTKVKPGRVDSSGVVRFLSDEEERRLRAALVERDDAHRAGRERGNAWRAERRRDAKPALGTYADHLTPMVLLSINTGLRRGELFNLTWPDVDLQRASLAVRGSGAKSGNTRHVPLNAQAVGVLRQWQQQTGADGLVFKSKDGERFNNVKRAWAALLAQAGITGFRWHDMRHHFASRLVMAGVDLNTVRELLGHSDLSMTLRYAHLAPEHKAAAVAKLVAG